MILKAVWNHLRGEPVARRLRRIERAYTCPRCRRRAIAAIWDPADLDEAVSKPCRRVDCEAVRREHDESSRRRAEAIARFDRARALGLAFRDAHRTEATGSDPEALVALATSRFDRDPAFRSLWCQVFDAPPSSANAAWLHLWTIGDV